MKKLVKILKKCFNVFAFCLGVRGTETGKEAERIGICDFSGQGKGD